MSNPDDYKLEPHARYGFLRVWPTPSAEDITRFYADEFYSGQYKNFNNSALTVQQADQPFHDAHRGDICRGIETIAGKPLAGMTVLDVGCGWAQTLLYMKEHGAECFGFDPAPEAVEYARGKGLNVRRAGMDTVEVFTGQRFDVVMLLNVLEHLADPEAVMQEIRAKVLRAGGILVIEVPNEFNAFQVAGQRTHGLPEWWVAPPGHLNYFSASTLRALLEGTGYRVELSEASFPLELFLLFGDNYVGDRALGRACHERRMAFEGNMRAQGREDIMHRFYAALAQLNLGRQVITFSVAT
jgi:2-polyprenyl-3-methyl-5-hydroxy-6-metoxy-1,4-benzoquinol methylase